MQNFVLVGKAKTILKIIELKANREKTDKGSGKGNKK